MQTRTGEFEVTHYRTGRFFCISSEWYFSTRENLQIGPFSNQDDAELELMDFLRHIQQEGIYPERYFANNTRIRTTSSREIIT